MKKALERRDAKSRGANRKELWIGFVKVAQPTGNGVLGRADRAYTNAVGMASGRAGFRATVKEALSELGLELIRLEDAESLAARLSKFSIDQELCELAKELANTDRVGFGTYHAFDTAKTAPRYQTINHLSQGPECRNPQL